MSDLWSAFREGGFANNVNLLLAMVGLGLAISAAAMARGKSGRLLGALSLGVGVLILAIGTYGAWSGRTIATAAVSGESVMQSQKDRIQREGYMEAAHTLDFGLGFAAIPVLLGAAVLLVGARREQASLAMPVGLVGLAGLLAVGDVTMLIQPLPGRDLPRGDPAWHLVDAYYMVTACAPSAGHCAAEGWRGACSALDSALHPPPGSMFYGVPQTAPDPAKVPDIDVPKLVATCAEHRASPPHR